MSKDFLSGKIAPDALRPEDDEEDLAADWEDPVEMLSSAPARLVAKRRRDVERSQRARGAKTHGAPPKLGTACRHHPDLSPFIRHRIGEEMTTAPGKTEAAKGGVQIFDSFIATLPGSTYVEPPAWHHGGGPRLNRSENHER